MTIQAIKFNKTVTFSKAIMIADKEAHAPHGSLHDNNDIQYALSFNNELTLNVSVYLNAEKLLSLFQSSCSSKKPATIALNIGVDEAGRGPLLGSVVVGAVILPPELCGEFEKLTLEHTAISQLNDSKKISEKKRDDLYGTLDSVALGYVAVDVPAGIIDDINILQASLLGMKVATEELIEQLATVLTPDNLSTLSLQALFDGNKVPKLDYVSIEQLGVSFDSSQAVAVVKGDAKFTSIAMASVLAKVDRDRQMYALAKRHPEYGIDKHKGYPTKAHVACLDQYGVLAEHRRSFAPVRARLIEVS